MNNFLPSLLSVFLLGPLLCEAFEFIPPEPVWWHVNVIRDPSLRTTDYPLITSDSFRGASDFIFDETKIPLNPDNVKDGDVIYVTTPYLDYFFYYVHPQIKSHYILLTHFGDQCVPGPYETNWSVLEDENLAYWIGMNVNQPDHPKMIQIPIGLAPKNIIYEDFTWKNEINKIPPTEKKHLLYLNHHDGTNLIERTKVRGIFSDKSFCYIQDRKSFVSYCEDLADSKFVLSPQGAGLDCYKTWEALLFGCIPIIKKTSIISLFDDLPVLVIEDWNEITEDFLNIKFNEMHLQKYNLDKLYVDYWLNLIKKTKKRVQNGE